MKNQKGFSVVVVLLALILVILVAFTGRYVWNSNTKKNTEVTTRSSGDTGSKEPAVSEVKKDSITNSTKSGYKVYTNNSLGYTLEFPDQLSTEKCQKTTTVNDNYGNKVTALPESYLATGSVTSGTVIESASAYNIYITPDKTAELSNTQKSTNLPDRDLYITCKDIAATPENLDAKQNNANMGSNYSFDSLDAYIEKINSTEIAKKLMDRYGSQDLTVALGPTNANGLQKVTPSRGLANGRVDVYYAPKNNLLVIWSLGQSCHLASKADKSDCGDADQSVINSFKVL